MKKVLHVLSDTKIGGAGRYLFNLISAWDKDRYEMMVACPAGGELEKQLETKGVKSFGITGGENSFKISHIKEILDIIAKEKVDIVHTHASFSGRVAGRLSGCGVVLTRHGLGTGKKDFIHRLITGVVSRLFTDRIIAISRAVKISLMETGVPAHMIKIIYNGIDLSRYCEVEPLLRRNLGISGDVPLIGIVARLVPEKGYEYAIKAMPHVLERFPAAQLVIVGDGPLKISLEKLCQKLDIINNVLFLGFQNQVESITADFDVFVLPSVSEGLGLAVLEAMALGKPVVATESGGIPEVIKNRVSGLLVPPKDEKALAKSIVEILSSRALAESLGKEAKRAVFEKFSALDMAKKTMEIYDEILRRTGELNHEAD